MEIAPLIPLIVVGAGAIGFLLAKAKPLQCKHRKHFYYVDGYWDISFGGRSKSYQFAWKCLDCGHTECGHVYGGGWPSKEWLNRMEPHQRLQDENEARAAAQAVVDRMKEKA